MAVAHRRLIHSADPAPSSQPFEIKLQSISTAKLARPQGNPECVSASPIIIYFQILVTKTTTSSCKKFLGVLDNEWCWNDYEKRELPITAGANWKLTDANKCSEGKEGGEAAFDLWQITLVSNTNTTGIITVGSYIRSVFSGFVCRDSWWWSSEAEHGW